jgi:peptidoglycan/xylan/chitin deacetylase (PgdA/CDA1 family)
MSAKAALRQSVKALLYHTGVASLLGRRAARDTLTVLMFHRVLPAGDPRDASADRVYTMELGIFESFLDFVRREFHPVSLAQVETAQSGGAPLPPHAVLITFDDGWEDTARYAAPALQARGLPSVVFVTSGVLTCQHTLWRDVAAILVRAGSLAPDVEASLEKLPWERRSEILQDALNRSNGTVLPLMMATPHLATVTGQGMAIGAHGATHTPLPDAPSPADEFGGGRAVLEAATGGAVRNFAFPHGRYDSETLAHAFAAGNKLVFTSDAILNAMEKGRPRSPLLGRITISQDQLTGKDGLFSPVRAAFFLMFRSIAALDRQAGSSAGY